MTRTRIAAAVLAALVIGVVGPRLHAQDPSVLEACQNDVDPTPGADTNARRAYGSALLGCAERASQGHTRDWEYSYTEALGFYYEGWADAGDHQRDLALGEFDRAHLSLTAAARADVRRSLAAHLDSARAASRELFTAATTHDCVTMASSAGVPVRPGPHGGIIWTGAVPIDRVNELTADDVRQMETLRVAAQHGLDVDQLLHAQAGHGPLGGAHGGIAAPQ